MSYVPSEILSVVLLGIKSVFWGFLMFNIRILSGGRVGFEARNNICKSKNRTAEKKIRREE